MTHADADPPHPEAPTPSDAPAAEWQRVKDVVADALDLEASERMPFIELECQGLTSLIESARELLASFESAGGFLDSTPAHLVSSHGGGESTDSSAGAQALIGRRVGSYDVTRFIAAGGMGAVYAAVHLKTGRAVALKLMRDSLGADRVSRFQREVEVLGRLQHDSIAQILDAGLYTGGSGMEVPYFALELVDGQPLSQYAATRTRHERIELTIQVCDGVQHAHERGIVHRDLKPDNLMVTVDGRVKILDFGIARLVAADDEPPTTAYTETGQFLGTLAYMSPEQLGGRPADLDSRCDVYALGVILYELLAQRLPLDPSDRPLLESAAMIRDVDPARLSSIDRSYRGDLDTIVMKALAKDKQRRYASVADLADDLRRYLGDEPISARPPTTWYQLSKFARRNRWLCGSVAGALVLLTLGIVGTGYGYFQAQAERRRVEEERDRAVVAQEEATAVSDFLATLLSSADPDHDGRDVRVRQVLDVASRDLDGKFRDRPAVAGRLHSVVGWTYHRLGDNAIALDHLRRAVDLQQELYGAGSPLTLETESRWVQVLLCTDNMALADTATHDLVNRTRAALGEAHFLANAALAHRALFLHATGKHAEANRDFTAAIAGLRGVSGDGTAYVQSVLNNHAILLSEMGQYQDAVAVLRELVRRHEADLGPEAATTVMSQLNLAYALSDVGAVEESDARFEQWLPVAVKVLGADHPDTISHAQNHGVVLTNLGEHARAVAVLRKAYDGRVARVGKDHSDTLTTLNNLCVSLLHLERFAEVEPLAQEMVAGFERTLGTSHPRYWQAAGTLGSALAALQRIDEAQRLLSHVLKMQQEHLGEEHPQAIISQNNYAEFLREAGQREEAAVHLAQVVDRYRRAVPDDERSLCLLQFNYGRVLHELGRSDAARVQLDTALQLGRASWGPDHPRTQKVIDYLRELPPVGILKPQGDAPREAPQGQQQ